jgi:transposase
MRHLDQLTTGHSSRLEQWRTQARKGRLTVSDLVNGQVLRSRHALFGHLVAERVQRLEGVQKIRERRLTATRAAELLHLSRSQVHRLLQAYDREGANGLASRKRGRPSNRRHTDDFRNLVLDLVRENYGDFGPTLAVEKLTEWRRVSVSKETLRKWMTEAGLWTSRRERRRQVHQPRGRRDCFGELVQIDGSHHWWFENRGPKCALLVYIDDATGKLLHLRFAASSSAPTPYRPMVEWNGPTRRCRIDW